MLEWHGSKGTTGLSQAVVSTMPVHGLFIETQLGGGAIMKRKPPAQRSIGIALNRRAMPPGERLAVLAAVMAVEAGE